MQNGGADSRKHISLVHDFTISQPYPQWETKQLIFWNSVSFSGSWVLLLYCFSTNERNNTDWVSYLAPLGPDVEMLEFIGFGCFPIHSEIFWRQNINLNVKCMYMSHTPCTHSLKVIIYIFNVPVLTVTCYMTSDVYSSNALVSPKF